MKKKFRVRVKYWGYGRFVVQWAHYRFFPIWHSLMFWFEQSVTSDTECWSTELFDSAEEAEKVAKIITSQEDLNRYYAPYEKERRDFYRRKKEFYESIPYSKKNIL